MSLPPRTYVKRFESMAQFVAGLSGKTLNGTGGTKFEGGETLEQSKRLASQGWPHIVDDANKIIADIEASGLIARGQPTYVNDVAGAFPNVPAYLAGSPECMFRRGRSELLGEQSPLSVYLDVSVSWDITAEQLKRRGIAILALVLILSERRPVELNLYSSLGSRAERSAQIPIVRIETQPLDISSATYALASAGFLRNLCFAFGTPHGFDGAWAWATPPTEKKHQDDIRRVLGASEQDLVIYGAYSRDPHIADPIKWLHSQLKLHMPQDE